MRAEFTQTLDAPLDEVFGWHERPGALHRLSPPWQPVTVRQEASSLRDGCAVLALPGGIRWVARHLPAGYQPPHQFVDRLDSAPLRAVLRWRHTHLFEAEGTGTRLIDRVDTSAPLALLRPMFDYRHAQLAADLAAHRWARALHPAPLTIAVTGSSGLIGSALVAFLSTGGHRVIRLVRRTPRTADERRWDPDDPDPALLTGVDAVVHLAGASIAGRFTPGHIRAIRSSRIDPTRRLAALAGASSTGVFVSASAIGYYGPERGDTMLAEDSDPGRGFLAEVVADWEHATRPAVDAGIRVVHVRTGLVQAPAGGMLRLLRPVFTAGLGGPIAQGRHWQSWIGLDDLLDIYLRALIDDRITGPVNAVSPHPVRNLDYSRTLAHVLRRPALLPTPSIGPRLLLGSEGAHELALADQRVLPQRLTDSGHQFRHPDLDHALRHALGR
ncbi:TIGR01777 family oxidoreductase [Actinocatenispora comari]|uniref:Nucleoside-diphosphate sugar epimerase n=1 Tax=Actinocatenispora comari TaxID=2807577 RepID=A0A8J4AG20_9ACTN|nr:TIGR01777 family oxidoreductase [Actinocatenispora comari]GIL30926.1 nucleoside-diphosphate sugar epimerase [Actinocatenispora comari]